MQGIPHGASESNEKSHSKCQKLQIFAGEFDVQRVLHQYYSSSWYILLYDSCVWFVILLAFARQRGLRSDFQRKTLQKMTLTPKIDPG